MFLLKRLTTFASRVPCPAASNGASSLARPVMGPGRTNTAAGGRFCERSYSSSSSPKNSGTEGGVRIKEVVVREGGLKEVAGGKQVEGKGRNIPFVPSTDHLHPQDVAISAFFAQHRPVSISHSVPISHSPSTFSSLFTSTPETFTPIPDLEPSNLDALTPATGIQLPSHLLNLSSTFRPFHPPPPPVPQTSTGRILSQLPQKQLITIVKSTALDGSTTFTARASMGYPFLERMMIRQRRWEESKREIREQGQEEEMFAISVKRQRKLKMKKHKYKKLMKRTRNLRRRIEKQ
ncbi:hypothetical protein RUND412_000884 [Rhizina undulata]